ncbi:MAG: EAL domain-containing protein [Clostridiales bacterium]|nr:EAL domain-containing protein [Clostridiales bacterium]
MAKAQPYKGRNSVLASAAVFCLLLIAAALYLTHYVRNLNKTMEEETVLHLTETAEQNVVSLQKQIAGDIRLLENVGSLLGRGGSIAMGEALDYLRGMVEDGGFKRMGVILPDGQAHTTDGYVQDFSDRQYFHEALSGRSSLSGTLTDKIGGGDINVYYAPILNGGKCLGVVFATHDTAVYREILSLSSFGGKGSFYLVAADGEPVIRPAEADTYIDLSRNHMADPDIAFSDPDAVTDMRLHMMRGESGVLQCVDHGVTTYINYTPVDTDAVDSWYLISLAPSSVITDRTGYILDQTLYLSVGIFVVLSALVAYNLYTQRRNERQLYALAFVDPLTGGANQTRFKREAGRLVRRYGGAKYALVEFDIDKFKYINDMFGYETGDRVLTGLMDILRRSLKPGELCARIINDKFVLLLEENRQEDIERRLRGLADRVASLSADLPRPYDFVLAFGICQPTDGTDIVPLLDRAALARKSGKGSHRTSVVFYSDSLHERIIKEKEIENRMETALKNREFVVYYQPKVLLSSGVLSGAEALVRWKHPEKGLIPPGDFIPLFERNGFIVNLDLYVFEEVCRKMRGWLDEGLDPVPVSVNLSRVHLQNPQFLERFRDIVEQYALPAGLLELELTESAVFDNVEVLRRLMHTLREAGFMLSMDDFGTGYSSLNLLKELPVDIVKIDREFFGECPDNERGKQVVAAVVTLAKQLQIRVVSEGVETAEQADFLRTIGCDMAQGYFFSTPIPEEDYEKRLRSRREERNAVEKP